MIDFSVGSLIDPLISFAENDCICDRITDIRTYFVERVDPSGYIMDYLLQERIVNVQLSQRMRAIATRQDRCRELLDELQSGGHPQAFVKLREALLREYSYIVDMIDQSGTGALIHYMYGE